VELSLVILKKYSSTSGDKVYDFHNLAHISGDTGRIIMKMLSRRHLWTRKWIYKAILVRRLEIGTPESGSRIRLRSLRLLSSISFFERRQISLVRSDMKTLAKPLFLFM